MKASKLICSVFMPLFLIGCAQMEKSKISSVPPGSQHSQTFEKEITKTLSCNYLLFLPEDYGKKRQRWPLIMFLHGAGERGSDLNKVKVHGPPKIVENRKDFSFIVVSPQCPEDDWWTGKVEVLINLLDDIVARYDVDTERIYLTGLSMGGFGTWSLASEYPERFAAIAPICGGGNRIMALRLEDMPVWVFHGAKDQAVPLEESEEMVKALRSRGGNVKFTIYPDAGHDSWTETYNNKKLYDWFLEHRKSQKKK
ncbi:MAG: prolyl oligopeptidase family serine peptidase [Phycisphaerae bacterium]